MDIKEKNKMTKNEMIGKIQEVISIDVTKKDLTEIVDAIATVVVDTLKNDKTEKVVLSGLGTFKVKEVPERRGVAALAGNKEWVKPAHSEITFKINKSIKEI